MPSDIDARFASGIVWIPFVNQSGQTVPPYSIIQATGWQMADPSGSSLDVTTNAILGVQPNGPINPSNCFITGQFSTPAGANGMCARPTLWRPLLCSVAAGQIDANDVPYRLVGPSSGSWQATRDYPGFAMVSQPQNGVAMIIPASQGLQLYQTVAGPSATAYPLLSATPTVYYAQQLQGAYFPQQVGLNPLQPVQNPATASYAYIFCDQTYLFQGTIVATMNQIVVGIVTGSRYEIGIAGVLASPLSSGGTSTATVQYYDCTGNIVDDTLTVNENIGLPSGQSLPTGTGVFIEWDNSLWAWVVVATSCSGNPPKDTPRPRNNSDTPISTGSAATGYGGF